MTSKSGGQGRDTYGRARGVIPPPPRFARSDRLHSRGVTVALDYYSMPGVPTRRITREEIDYGECELRRDC